MTSERASRAKRRRGDADGDRGVHGAEAEQDDDARATAAAPGIASSTSTRRMMTASTSRPREPAIRPSSGADQQADGDGDEGAGQRMDARRRRCGHTGRGPSASVPSKCSALGRAQLLAGHALGAAVAGERAAAATAQSRTMADDGPGQHAGSAGTPAVSRRPTAGIRRQRSGRDVRAVGWSRMRVMSRTPSLRSQPRVEHRIEQVDDEVDR